MIFYIWTVKLGLNEDSFFTSSFGRVMYMIDTWTKEQKAIADATNQGNNPMPQKSIPATSMKSVLKGLI